MNARLNSADVERVLFDCLYRDGESTDGAVMVEGLVRRFGFHPGRLAAHRTEIEHMLSQLPTEFMETGGGGWTFLNACNDRDGEQWTGMHSAMEELFCLGIGLDLVGWQLPRGLWGVLPGGVPYVTVYDSRFEAS